jgi:hypothetical protein
MVDDITEDGFCILVQMSERDHMARIALVRCAHISVDSGWRLRSSYEAEIKVASSYTSVFMRQT